MVVDTQQLGSHRFMSWICTWKDKIVWRNVSMSIYRSTFFIHFSLLCNLVFTSVSFVALLAMIFAFLMIIALPLSFALSAAPTIQLRTSNLTSFFDILCALTKLLTYLQSKTKKTLVTTCFKVVHLVWSTWSIWTPWTLGSIESCSNSWHYLLTVYDMRELLHRKHHIFGDVR